MKWIIIGAALALSVLFTACGTDSITAVAETPQQTEVASVAPTMEPIPWVSDAVDNEPEESASPELPEEPVEEPFVPCTVGLMPESEAVDESWFSDAVFLGDSRTDGLKLYGGIKGADFFSYKGLSVFTIDDKKCITVGETKITVLEALAQKQYAKVFIMLGINELGYKDLEAFKQAYSDLVAMVREIQPDADIYLQLQPPVNEAVAKKKGMSENITNERIDIFNAIITEVAEEHETALVNVWESLVDEEGSLPADITSDGVHMKRDGYVVWYDYLRTHTGTLPPVENTETDEPVGADVPEEADAPEETDALDEADASTETDTSAGTDTTKPSKPPIPAETSAVSENEPEETKEIGE